LLRLTFISSLIYSTTKTSGDANGFVGRSDVDWVGYPSPSVG
jgi:hypothetical protein